MEAIILAGGFGRRLQSVVRDVPKPMADINGRPFLSYLMDLLAENGIEKVLLSVGYRHDIIVDYFGARYKTIEIEYVIEDRPLGTGGAIRESLNKARCEDVLVINGDTLFYIDIRKFFDFHIQRKSLFTIALKPMNDFERYGTVVVEDDRVTGFEEKSFRTFGYINGGIYGINKTILEYFNRFDQNFSIETDFLQKCLREVNVFASIHNGYFIDIGIPEDYQRAQKDLPNLLHKGHLP
jgi:D-glycero-alpha-D-manno-heptose 1-phosphate guanylyltransferase